MKVFVVHWNKKNRNYKMSRSIIFSFLMLLFFVACDRIEYEIEDQKPSFELTSDTTYNFTFDSGKHLRSVKITSNSVWVAEVEASASAWLTLTTTSGKKGDGEINFMVDNNNSGENRSGKIIVYVSNTTVIFTINQTTFSDFSYEQNTTIFLTKEQQDTVFRFYADVEWKATLESSASSWLTIESSGMQDEAKVVIKVSENRATSDREGKITVTGPHSSFVITVIQTFVLDFDIFTVMDDDNFKEYCKIFDTNNDGKLLFAEANVITSINIPSNVRSVTGIEYFKNLTTVLGSTNDILASLNFDGNPELQEINLSDFKALKMIDVSNNTKLVNLTCTNSSITSLNVSSSTELETLICDNSVSLTSLDLRNNIALKNLSCSGCLDLSTLNVSRSTVLRTVNCSGCNSLLSLDLSNNPLLETLNCNNCYKLASINASNTALKQLECNNINALTTIIAFNSRIELLTSDLCNALAFVNVSNCSNLQSLMINKGSISSLNMRGCKALKRLKLYQTAGISTLNISEQVALVNINIGSGDLTSLDLSKNVELDSLHITNNYITELDITNNLKMTYLYCVQKNDNSGTNYFQTLYMKESQKEILEGFIPGTAKVVYK